LAQLLKKIFKVRFNVFFVVVVVVVVVVFTQATYISLLQMNT